MSPVLHSDAFDASATSDTSGTSDASDTSGTSDASDTSGTSDPTPSVADAKRAARARVRAIRKRRAAWPGDDPRRTAEAAALAEAVLVGAGHLLTDRTTVASYVSLPTEPGTAELHRRLFEAGARVIVPVLLPDKDLDWVHVRSDGAATGLPLGLKAIAEARLVVVPALAVDGAGRRLGQGGGSYDRALARRDPAALVVALVDDEGLVAQVPHEPHDAKVAGVIRPTWGWTALPLPSSICENDSASA